MFADSVGGGNSGWVELGQWTVPAPVITANSVTPAIGTGLAQTFTLDYSSNLGAADLSSTWVWFNATIAASAAGSCLVYYEPQSNGLYLLNDAGSQWQPALLGTAYTLQNSQCAIDLAASSTTVNGNTRRLNLAVTFRPAFAGTKNIYLYAAGSGGSSSGWQDRGDWTVGIPVTADSVLPNSGSGYTQTFALAYSSGAGAGTLTSTWAWFNATMAQSAAGSCLVYYEPSSNNLHLLNDAGTTWASAVLGTVATLQNGQCAIDVAASSTTATGNTLTLNLATTFKAGFAGTKNIYLYAAGTGSFNSGWQDRGDWTVPLVVSADSVTPGSGAGSAQTFTLTYSSAFGAGDLATTWVWVNATLAQTAAGSCLVYYDNAGGTLHLLDDAGAVWQSAVPGTSAPLQNSQCRIDVSASP